MTNPVLMTRSEKNVLRFLADRNVPVLRFNLPDGNGRFLGPAGKTIRGLIFSGWIETRKVGLADGGDDAYQITQAGRDALAAQ